MKCSHQQSTLTSGELGNATGVSADTIRHYEKLGLLAKPMRSEGRYRLYPPDALNRVKVVRSALVAGFTLAQLVDIFRERAAGGVPCHRVAELAAQKVRRLDLQIRELADLRDWLVSTGVIWKQRLERMPPGTRAGLLEMLPELDAAFRIIAKGNHNENRPLNSRSVRFRGSSNPAEHAGSS